MKSANRPLGKVTSMIVDDASARIELQIRDNTHNNSPEKNVSALEMVQKQNETIARLEAKKERALMKGKCSF